MRPLTPTSWAACLLLTASCAQSTPRLDPEAPTDAAFVATAVKAHGRTVDRVSETQPQWRPLLAHHAAAHGLTVTEGGARVLAFGPTTQVAAAIGRFDDSFNALTGVEARVDLADGAALELRLDFATDGAAKGVAWRLNVARTVGPFLPWVRQLGLAPVLRAMESYQRRESVRVSTRVGAADALALLDRLLRL